MIGGFNNSDFDLKSPIAEIKCRQIKALYGIAFFFYGKKILQIRHFRQFAKLNAHKIKGDCSA